MNNFLLKQIKAIDFEDLKYVEQDLCTYELVSLGFLLYGEPRAPHILQRLLVGFNARKVTDGDSPKTLEIELLSTYAKKLNPDSWREYVLEALCIINARRVLSKLGFVWIELKTYFLPQIREFSVNIHPILKVLYKVCEQLTEAQAVNMINYVDTHHNKNKNWRFFDWLYTEVFLLHWMNENVISLGDRKGQGTNLSVLFEYFKLNDFDQFKNWIVDAQRFMMSPNNESVNSKTEVQATTTELRDVQFCYEIRKESAGIVLIINQREFTIPDTGESAGVFHRSLGSREGTDADCQKLASTFCQRGYKQQVLNNVKSLDMLHCIRETVKRCALFDSIVVCVLTHGYRGHVYGADSKAVAIDDIEEAMSGESLKDKPKLLIIQACQTDTCLEAYPRNKFVPKIEHSADMLRAMSVLPGHAAIRHSIQGSWFIQSLCENLHEYGDRENLVDILVMVNADVSRKQGTTADQRMVTQTSTSLRKKLYLPKKD